MFVAFAILGMGGAPIAEYFELPWLVILLQWIAYISVAVLLVATVVIGGLGMYHGILTVLGKSPGTLQNTPTPAPLPNAPRVDGPGLNG